MGRPVAVAILEPGFYFAVRSHTAFNLLPESYFGATSQRIQSRLHDHELCHGPSVVSHPSLEKSGRWWMLAGV
jgi:hypothetical protein